MIEQVAKWLSLAILIVSSISFIIVFQLDYVAEALTARAVPIAIVLGLSSIATSLIFKK